MITFPNVLHLLFIYTSIFTMLCPLDFSVFFSSGVLLASYVDIPVLLGRLVSWDVPYVLTK